MNERLLINLLIVLLVLGTMLNFLIPLSIVYLAYVIKKRLGKDNIDRFVKAARISVQAAKEYINQTEMNLKDQRNLAFDIAKKILAKDGIYVKTKKDIELLEDVIEAFIYKTKK